MNTYIPKTYYPTPEKLIEKMIYAIKRDKRQYWGKIRYILEPSAGTGSIIQKLEEFLSNPIIDAVEIDPTFCDTLRGKGYNVHCEDFLEFEPEKFYDLIIMNPPFDKGVDHLFRAIEIQERTGGQIVCLLNSQNIKSPNTKRQQELVQKLSNMGASIEYVEGAFATEETFRKTNVEVAMIQIHVPTKDIPSFFERELRKEAMIHPGANPLNAVAKSKSKLEQLVTEYDLIRKAIIAQYQETERINKLLSGFNVKNRLLMSYAYVESYNSLNGDQFEVNSMLETLNREYWKKLIDEVDFENKLPSELKDSFRQGMQQKENIAFTLENVQYFALELQVSIQPSYEKTVARIFDSYTCKYHYSDTQWNKTIHMYNGWKTNDCWKIKNKVIHPCSREWTWETVNDLRDLNLVFENISGKSDPLDQYNLERRFKDCEKKIETEFFLIDSYKKGTIHITFKNPEYVEIFNLMASKGKNWIPSDFGEKPYSDLSDEEKELAKNYGLNELGYMQLHSQCTTKQFLPIPVAV